MPPPMTATKNNRPMALPINHRARLIPIQITTTAPTIFRNLSIELPPLSRLLLPEHGPTTCAPGAGCAAVLPPCTYDCPLREAGPPQVRTLILRSGFPASVERREQPDRSARPPSRATDR